MPLPSPDWLFDHGHLPVDETIRLEAGALAGKEPGEESAQETDHKRNTTGYTIPVQMC
jgi:hypothetical protein